MLHDMGLVLDELEQELRASAERRIDPTIEPTPAPLAAPQPATTALAITQPTITLPPGLSTPDLLRHLQVHHCISRSKAEALLAERVRQ